MHRHFYEGHPQSYCVTLTLHPVPALTIKPSPQTFLNRHISFVCFETHSLFLLLLDFWSRRWNTKEYNWPSFWVSLYYSPRATEEWFCSSYGRRKDNILPLANAAASGSNWQTKQLLILKSGDQGTFGQKQDDAGTYMLKMSQK